MAEPDHVADGIRNAGALFIGRYAPTVVGDYFAGPSHVLPTNRTARFFSPLGVPDFMKRTSLIRYSGRAIEQFRRNDRKIRNRGRTNSTCKIDRHPTPSSLKSARLPHTR